MDKIFSGKELGKGKGGISFLTKDEFTYAMFWNIGNLIVKLRNLW